MQSKVLRQLQEHQLIPAKSHVICALSGGADSVAMTHLLHSLQKTLDFRLSACHFNHQLRGAESDGDEAFCQEFCQSLGIDLVVGTADVRAHAKTTGESLEEAARHCRYAFFAEQKGLIATAHTADDQVETVLLNLLRGTGLKGLGGIPAQRDGFLRPLLQASREEVLSYLETHKLPHREDSSNQADDCLRNRLRHQVVPLLKAENPALCESVERMTALLRQDEDLLQLQADALLQPDADGWAAAPLQQADAPLRRRAIRSLLQTCHIPKLSAAHILAAETVLLGDDPSAGVTLPMGWSFCREYERVKLLSQDADLSFSPVTLPCPGSVEIPALSLRFTADFAAQAPILIRPRREGDKIRLSGGTKSVKKLFIDKKIPARQRESIPILEQNGQILSVWGVANSVDFTQNIKIRTERKRGD